MGSRTEGASCIIEQMYEQYWQCLYRHALRMVRDEALAEDLVQETFKRAVQALPRMPENLKIKPWLYRIATNLCCDVLRRRRLIAWQSLEALDREPAGCEYDDPQTVYAGPSELVHLALTRMKPLYREALLLSLSHEATQAEIAAAVGIVPGGVKMYLSRARQQFRALYQEVQEEVAL
jgi:RNA polymerase sigma-70 factor (ECF subfamily)